MAASFERNMDSRVSDRLESPVDTLPQFDFTEYFHGHTRASGWFSDRFGKPRRHFCGDFYGYYENGQFVLDEKLFYTDGVVEVRQWCVNIDENGHFSAESDSLINGARGHVKENRLAMSYSMKVKIEEGRIWHLDMKDQMILQPDGSLHNITQVCKWGLRIGTVCTQYLRHDGENLCAKDSAGSTNMSDLAPVRHLTSVSS